LQDFSPGPLPFLGCCWPARPGFIFGLDHANLLFHEAGHPIIGLFSNGWRRMAARSGNWFSRWRWRFHSGAKGQALAFAAAVIWFFENWLNIARYMADARALELPLVGGGDHDWNTIFTRWDIPAIRHRHRRPVKFLAGLA